ncbi:hypothetical protein FQA39_LY09149 [Lamprigera yunnana]|nr:hypothetical protein FQA39_LY09149 [Lamprigera yunnana]
MNNNSEVYKLKDLEKLALEALFDFINGTSEEQALNSDIGDSDAEDNLVYDTSININEPSTSYSTRSSVWNNSENRKQSYLKNPTEDYKPINYGWTQENDNLNFNWFEGEQLPSSYSDIIHELVVDDGSVATSCIQLAKERIIKYSNTKYNINDFKTGDCETMLLNQRIYYLNNSKSKWISVGLYHPFEFSSVVKIFGRSKQYAIFKEEEWIQFREQRENINKIEDVCGNKVYLGWESMSEVWSLQTVLSYRLSYSSGSNFKHFYDDVIRAVAEMSGDVKINIYNIVNRLSEKSDDVCCMLEILLFMPEKALFYVQLERRIQEQAIDLKSAVERLYEKLGALEFDADHEAIYGMEKYYTVEQCEKLRDKYKIGRKGCRQFLKGKTCSQCLVKRISDIGLQHFLDTISKYIKDCSDSDTSLYSSDEEECKEAVKQDGEDSKTTEEEE